MPNSLNPSSTKDNDRQVNGLHIKDIIEMQLKPYQSNTLYSPTQVLLGRKTVNTLSLIDSGAGLDLIDRTLVKNWSLPRRKLKKTPCNMERRWKYKQKQKNNWLYQTRCNYRSTTDQTQAYYRRPWTTTNYTRNSMAQETQSNYWLEERYDEIEKCWTNKEF